MSCNQEPYEHKHIPVTRKSSNCSSSGSGKHSQFNKTQSGSNRLGVVEKSTAIDDEDENGINGNTGTILVIVRSLWRDVSKEER